jgi:membrane associated rhomboid family serine protease
MKEGDKMTDIANTIEVILIPTLIITIICIALITTIKVIMSNISTKIKQKEEKESEENWEAGMLVSILTGVLFTAFNFLIGAILPGAIIFGALGGAVIGGLFTGFLEYNRTHRRPVKVRVQWVKERGFESFRYIEPCQQSP